MSVFEAQTQSGFLTGSVVTHRTSGELDDRSRFKLFKSSERVLAYIVIHEAGELSASLIAALVCLARSDRQRQFCLSNTDFSIHIGIGILFWKKHIFVCLYHVLSSPEEKTMDFIAMYRAA